MHFGKLVMVLETTEYICKSDISDNQLENAKTAKSISREFYLRET